MPLARTYTRNEVEGLLQGLDRQGQEAVLTELQTAEAILEEIIHKAPGLLMSGGERA